MTAKEMFKRQNYDVLIDDDRKIVYKLRKVNNQSHNYKALPKEIIFWKYEEVDSIDFKYGRLGSYLYMELLQAINQQVKELGRENDILY